MLFSKKIVLTVAALGSIVFILSAFSKEVGICPTDNYSYCLDYSNQMSEVLLPFVALLISGFMTFLLRPVSYLAWNKFLLWYIPLSMFLILMTPEYGGFIDPIDKGSVAVATSLLFVICSIVIIGRGYLSGRTS